MNLKGIKQSTGHGSACRCCESIVQRTPQLNLSNRYLHSHTFPLCSTHASKVLYEILSKYLPFERQCQLTEPCPALNPLAKITEPCKVRIFALRAIVFSEALDQILLLFCFVFPPETLCFSELAVPLVS